MIAKVTYTWARKLVHLNVLRNLALLDTGESTTIRLLHIRDVGAGGRKDRCVEILLLLSRWLCNVLLFGIFFYLFETLVILLLVVHIKIIVELELTNLVLALFVYFVIFLLNLIVSVAIQKILLFLLLSFQGLLPQRTGHDLFLLEAVLRLKFTSFLALVFMEVELYVVLLGRSRAPPIVYFEIAILGGVLVWKIVLLRLWEWWPLFHQVFIHIFSTLEVPRVAHALALLNVLLSQLGVVHLSRQILLNFLLYFFLFFLLRLLHGWPNLLKGVFSSFHELHLSDRNGCPLRVFRLIFGFHYAFGGLFLQSVYSLTGILSYAHLTFPLLLVRILDCFG